MEIILDNIGKRYRFDWIFRNVDYQFESGQKYAITGPNGSGKSTFLKVICGYLSPTKGRVTFKNSGQLIDINEVYKSISYTAPYIELIEEFTLTEAIRFHLRFKKMHDDLSLNELIELSGLGHSRNKEIRYFSSGMKQRVKLLLAICSETPVLLLDEPGTNLDEEGIGWYLNLINKYSRDRMVVVASNVKADYQFCDQNLEISDFKKKKAKAG